MAWSILVEPESPLDPRSDEYSRIRPGRYRRITLFGQTITQDTLTGETIPVHWADVGPASHGRRHGELTFSDGPWAGLPVPGIPKAKLGKKSWVKKILEPAGGMVISGLYGWAAGRASAWLTRESLWRLGSGSIYGELGTMSLGAAQLVAGYALPAVTSWGASYLPGARYSGLAAVWGAAAGYWFDQGATLLQGASDFASEWAPFAGSAAVVGTSGLSTMMIGAKIGAPFGPVALVAGVLGGAVVGAVGGAFLSDSLFY